MVPDVTAIVTCMSDAERPFLTETLQSVRNQTVPCETIVVVLESKPGLMKYRKRCPDYALSDGRLAGLERRPTAGLEQSNGVHRLSGRRRCLVAHKDGEARGFNEIRPRRDTIISHPFDPDMRQGEDGAGGSALGTQCVSTASLTLDQYRVRRLSLSTGSPSKRRKLAFARLSTLPMTRWLLLASTCMLHRLSRRTYYAPLKGWGVNSARTA